MTSFEAKINLPTGAFAPDNYDPSQGLFPPDNFTVSRNRDGSTASIFSDLSWNLSAYHPESKCSWLNFNYWNEDELTAEQERLAREARWLMILLMYVRQGSSLSFGTLYNYLKVIKHVSRFCEVRSIRIQDVLADPVLLIASLNGEADKAAKLGNLILNLHKMGFEQIGFEISDSSVIRKLQTINAAYAATLKQHAPIPTRIYSSVIATLSSELDKFEAIAERLIDLLQECISDPLMGRQVTAQWQIKKRLSLDGADASKRPDFINLLGKYNLTDYFLVNNFTMSTMGLSRAVAETMLIAKTQIQIFTGMRSSEANSLPYNCLDTEERDGNTHFIIKGRTTKLNGGRIKRTQWVTSQSGRRAVLIAQKISGAIYDARGFSPKNSLTRINEFYLFITPFKTNGSKRMQWKSPCGLKLHVHGLSAVKNRLQPLIEENDLQELEKIDPHRAWRSEADYQIGQPWTLKSHQFRRSLALYAQRSGLVSLPSLKRQLQHITNEMSWYYCRGSAFATNFIGDDKDHFGWEWQGTQQISQFLSYAAHVLLTDETQFGAHANWIDHRLKDQDGVVIFDRDATMRRFEKGQMSFKETILGGCIKVGECDKRAIDLLDITCLSTGCKNMVGSLLKLDRVVAAKSHQVEYLRLNDPASVEYRTENGELEILLAARRKINEKDQ